MGMKSMSREESECETEDGFSNERHVGADISQGRAVTAGTFSYGFLEEAFLRGRHLMDMLGIPGDY